MHCVVCLFVQDRHLRVLLEERGPPLAKSPREFGLGLPGNLAASLFGRPAVYRAHARNATYDALSSYTYNLLLHAHAQIRSS